MPERPRAARAEDLADMQDLEARAFPPERRASPRSLRHSLQSPHQSVWVVGRPAIGLLVLLHHARTTRIYDIAIDGRRQGEGHGVALLEVARREARRRGHDRIRLEASVDVPALVPWYEAHGFRVVERLRDYYGPRRHAVRLEGRP